MYKLCIKIFFFAAFLIFFSCSRPVENKLADISENADKIEIFFYNGKESNIDDRSKIIIINDRAQIRYLLSFISEKDSPEYKCGYHGSIKVFNDNVETFETEFNLEADCMHFSFILDNKLYFKEMTPEGRNYLEELFLSPDNNLI